jgi:hypothetical protein
MLYRNSELRVDQIVTYLNEEKINLSPVFQRGHVWTLAVRKKLVKNILQGKPIPAIFLYKEPAGSKYSYNILDGKQRLESLMLYIGNEREDMRITQWKKYFFSEKLRKDVGYAVEFADGKNLTCSELDDAVVRELREYSIPTIEITLNDESTLDDMINLFVDINQYGVKVNRFDIVKAMGRNDEFLMDVFGLVAEKQKRGEDIFYRTKRTPFTNILKTVNVIQKIADGKSQVDRMWERLLEIVLFQRTLKHRKPVEILKGFISKPEHPSARLSPAEATSLRKLFVFFGFAYKETTLASSRLATDQTHFYSMVTTLIATKALQVYGSDVLKKKLEIFGSLLDDRLILDDEHAGHDALRQYRSLSTRQTTDVSKRADRQKYFAKVLEAI